MSRHAELAQREREEHVDRVHDDRIYIPRLCHKLERDPARPKLLLTETGVGYRMREPG